LLAFAVTVAAAPPSAARAPVLAAPGGPSCVKALVDVHTGSGDKSFSSHYVFVGAWSLGAWVAGRVRGQSLWQHRGAAWCKVTGGAALDARDLQIYGVPASVAQRLVALQPPAKVPGH
jgi:hypothetical protein